MKENQSDLSLTLLEGWLQSLNFLMTRNCGTHFKVLFIVFPKIVLFSFLMQNFPLKNGIDEIRYNALGN